MSPTRGVGSREVGSGCLQPGAGPEPPLAGVYRDLVRGQLAARGMFLYHSSHTSALHLERQSGSWQSMKAGHGTGLPPFLSLSSSLKSRQPAKAPRQSVRRAPGGRGEDGLGP